MKKLLILLPFLFSQTLFAQNDWLGNVHFDSSVEEIFVKSNGQVVLQLNDALVVLDSSGTLVKKLVMNGEYSGEIGGILEQGDSTLVLYDAGECDIVYSVFYVFDKDWNLTSEIYPAVDFYYGVASFFRLSDGSWIIYDADGITRYSADLDITLGHRAIDGAGAAIVLLPGDTLIFIDGEQLIKMTSDFELVQSTTTAQVLGLELASDGTLLALGLNWIAKYDTDLNQLDSVSFSGGHYVKSTVSNGEFAVLTDAPSVLRFHNDLQLAGEFEVEKTESMTLNDISYYGGKLLIGGGKKWGTNSNSNQSGFLKYYTLTGQINPIAGDVGLVSVEHQGTIHSSLAGSNPFLWNVTFTGIKLIIGNNSADTLHSVVLNTRMSEINLPFWCSLLREYSWKIEGLDIPPGQNGEVFLDSIQLLIGNDAQEFSPCFWLSLPNGSWDTDNENDVFCASLPVAAKPGRLLKEFSVFPNPAGGQLQVARESWMPAAQASYVLTDVLGRTIAVWNVEPASDRQSLNLENVPAGVYTLLIKSRGQVLGAARVVKQ